MSLEEVVREHGFILFSTPNYDDELFKMFNGIGYVYGRDYLIYTPEAW